MIISPTRYGNKQMSFSNKFVTPSLVRFHRLAEVVNVVLPCTSTLRYMRYRVMSNNIQYLHIGLLVYKHSTVVPPLHYFLPPACPRMHSTELYAHENHIRLLLLAVRVRRRLPGLLQWLNWGRYAMLSGHNIRHHRIYCT